MDNSSSKFLDTSKLLLEGRGLQLLNLIQSMQNLFMDLSAHLKHGITAIMTR